MIENKSVEKLEAEIAGFYWEAYQVDPFVRVQEAGVLADLWAEFDRRVRTGQIEID